MKNLLIICLLLQFLPSFSQQNTDTSLKVAMDYMEAYGDWDFDKMKTFYADNVHFEDPTGSEAFGQPIVHDGKDNVYSFFKGVFKDKFENDRPPYVDFKIERVFNSGSFVVVNSTFECLIPTSWYKANSTETILIAIPFVTILKVQNGLVQSHYDYGDYSKYNEQIEAQIKG